MIDASKFGLKPQVVEALGAVFKKYPQIQNVILYGSRAKGTYKTSSDIDLTLVGEKVDLSMQLKIENEIDDLLLPYKVDLSLFHQIENGDLIEHIKQFGIALF